MTRPGFATLVRKTRQSTGLLPRNDVLYIDKRVVVINKPPGLVSQASSKEDDQLKKFLCGTRCSKLYHHIYTKKSTCQEIQSKHKLDGPLFPVHRLDKVSALAHWKFCLLIMTLAAN